MNSERAGGDRLVAVGRLQRLFDEMTLPTSDSFMEWKFGCCPGIEYARCLVFRSIQFLLYLFGGNSPTTGLDGGAFDQVLQFPHVAWKGIALKGQHGI